MPTTDARLREIDAALDALGVGVRRRSSRLPRMGMSVRDLAAVDAILDELGRGSSPAAPRAERGSVPPGLAAPPAVDADGFGPGMSGTAPSSAAPVSNPAPEAAPASRATADPGDPRALDASMDPAPLGDARYAGAFGEPATTPAPSVPPILSEPGPGAPEGSLPPPGSPTALGAAGSEPGPGDTPALDDAPPTDLELRVPSSMPSEAPVTVPHARGTQLSSSRLVELFGEDPDDPDAGSFAGPLPGATPAEDAPVDDGSWEPSPSGAASSPPAPDLPDAAALWPSHTASSAPAAAGVPDDSAASATPDPALHDFAPTPIRPVPSAPPPMQERSVPPPPPPGLASDDFAELDELIIVEPEDSAPASLRAGASAPSSAGPVSSAAYEEALDDLLDFADSHSEGAPPSAPDREAIERATSVAPSAPERGDPSVEISVEEELLSEDSIVANVRFAGDSIDAPSEPAALRGHGPDGPDLSPPDFSAEDAGAADEGTGGGAEDGDPAESEAPKGFFSRIFGRK